MRPTFILAVFAATAVALDDNPSRTIAERQEWPPDGDMTLFRISNWKSITSGANMGTYIGYGTPGVCNEFLTTVSLTGSDAKIDVVDKFGCQFWGNLGCTGSSIYVGPAPPSQLRPTATPTGQPGLKSWKCTRVAPAFPA
jgi:hypothetical protein